MELSLLVSADYANTTNDGKLNVMGIFGNINAPTFPAVHPEMYIIVQLLASPAEYNRTYKFEIKIIDEDGQELGTFPTTNTVPKGERGRNVTLNHVLRLVNTNFPTPGAYEFVVLIDNDVKGSLSIDVNQYQAP